jgi:hypothetical protein
VQNTRVSAVLVADHVGPWRIPEALPTLWHHPAAEHPLPVFDAPWRQAAIDKSTGAIAFVDSAIALRDLFGLAADWPGPEPAFPD